MCQELLINHVDFCNSSDFKQAVIVILSQISSQLSIPDPVISGAGCGLKICWDLPSLVSPNIPRIVTEITFTLLLGLVLFTFYQLIPGGR